MSAPRKRTSHTGSEAHLSSRASYVAVLVAVAFLSIPLLQTWSIGTESLSSFAGDSDGLGTANSPMNQSMAGGGNAKHWDWANYADNEGFVDVIVSSSTGSSKALDIFKHWKTGGFSRAFNGFTARVALDVLAEYSSTQDSSLIVYPDVLMNATMSESVYQVGADQVWMMTDASGDTVRGTGVVVAIIDTGIDYTHPDLGEGSGLPTRSLEGMTSSTATATLWMTMVMARTLQALSPRAAG